MENSEAFPIVLSDNDFSAGLTKREYYSIRILSALLSNPNGHELIGLNGSDETSAKKYVDYTIRMTQRLFKQLDEPITP